MGSVIPAGLTMNAIYAQVGDLLGIGVVLAFVILGLALYLAPRILGFIKRAGKSK